MYTLEKDVSIPSQRNGRARYPFADMEIGDSFVAPAEENKGVRSAAHSYSKRHGKTFTCHRQVDGTVRVWRVADPSDDN